MKICHFIASRGLGRGEAYIDLVNSLCLIMDIDLIIPKGALYKNRIHPNINVYEYDSKNSRKNPFLLFEIYALIKKIKPDVVHTHFAKATEIFHPLNVWFLKLPHVATKHNPRKGKIFNKIPHVIAVSHGVAQSIDHQNVTIIYNGISPEKVVKEPKKNTPFQICAIGRLDPIKGFDILINECAKLNFDFELLIIGDGEEREYLEALIQENALQKNVKLIGFQTAIPQFMAHADMVIMSSHSEGFSLVMVEALFYANLFISTKVSGATEILDEKFLIDGFDIATKLNAIHHHQDEYKHAFSLLQQSIQKNFLLETITKQYQKYYQNLLLQ